MDIMHLQLHFLVLRVMIQYHIMIPLSSLSSLIDVPHQLFACMECIIQLMILALWLALGFDNADLVGTIYADLASPTVTSLGL
jgi:hypothetical protein